MKKTLILFSLVLLLISYATADENLITKGKNPLSQAELEILFKAGPTARITTARGNECTSIHHTDGRIETKCISADTGTYSLKNGEFCTKYISWRGGKEQCMKIYKVEDNKYMTIKQDGNLNSTFSLIP